MRIVSAELIGWRNYEHQSLVFDGSPTLLIGRNGQGKTNFVEALVYAALGHSHRTRSDSVLVKSGLPEAIIRMTVQHDERTLVIDLRVTQSGTNAIRVNGTATKRRDLARLLPLVLFAPEDMDIVRGEPDKRRELLNDIVSEASPALAGDIADYDRVLRQRNTLLKTLRSTTSPATGTLDTWTDSLIDFASRIMVARRRAVRRIDPLIAGHYSTIASTNDRVGVSLIESIPVETTDHDVAIALREVFHEKRREEIDRGLTLVGPHRDDLAIVLNGLPARTHSSQGEAWSCALAIRLAQIDVLRETSVAGDPVVILDDVFSELDAGRRRRLGEHLTGIEHVIITAADIVTVPQTVIGKQHTVKEGRIDA
jgi:DNA replication and repair protein RecF